MTKYRIAWPQDRWVTESFIHMKYRDAVASGEAELVGLTNILEIMEELSDIGQVTFTGEEREDEEDFFDDLNLFEDEEDCE